MDPSSPVLDKRYDLTQNPRFAIRRTDNRFWTHSDSLIEGYRKTYPIEAGLFDYNRFENR